MGVFIDATTFLAMHSSDETKRIAAKNFFIENYTNTLYMTFEDVGMCDDIIWQYDRTAQDLYYPFMDRLHTVIHIKRIPYASKIMGDLKLLAELNLQDNLLLSMVTIQRGKLYTFNSKLLNLRTAKITTPEKSNFERVFPTDLEQYYQTSLALRIKQKTTL